MFGFRSAPRSANRNTDNRSRFLKPSLEILEDRVTPSWFGAPPEFIAPPTTAVRVSLNAAGDATGAASITRGEEDFFTFVAPTDGAYRLAVNTPSSNLDPVLGVFNAAGQRLAFNDDVAFPNTDSQLFVTLDAGQRYFFGVSNFTDGAQGSYTWVVDGERGDDTFENNDTRATAFNLGTLTQNRTVNDLVLADGNDYFRFTMNARGTASDFARITFDHTQGNLGFAIYTNTGTLVRSSNTATNVEQLSLNNLNAGTYVLRVFAAAGVRNPHYTLDIDPAAVVPPAPTPPAPTPVPGGFSIQLNFSGLTANQTNIFNAAADRWEQIIVGDLPDATFNGRVIDDVAIDVRFVAIDGQFNILGQAGPDALRAGSRLPIHGFMEFDTADMARMEANGELMAVAMHEMGHVLGIGTIWAQLGLVQGAGTANSRFVGAQATAAYNAIFGRNEAGVPLETNMGPGSNDSHWRESLFGAELMSPAINSRVANPTSRVTVASLADIGYRVNLAAADLYTPPGGGAALTAGATGTGTGASLMHAHFATEPTLDLLALDADLVNSLLAGNAHRTEANGNQETARHEATRFGNWTNLNIHEQEAHGDRATTHGRTHHHNQATEFAGNLLDDFFARFAF
jgi:hypothetical protein